MKEEKFYFFLMTICAVMFLVGMAICANQRETLKREAVERGHAHYNPTNGVWQWKEAK